MARRLYEMAFEINGKLAGNFASTFATANSKIDRLKIDLRNLNDQYKKGVIDAKKYEDEHQKIARAMQAERNQIEEARRALDRYHSSQTKVSGGLLSRMGSAASGSVRNMLTAGVAGGAVAVGAGGFFLGSSLSKSMEYEAQLASIQALTGIVNEELAKMDALALKMGADTKYSALQAAQGIEELLKAGISPATVQAGGLEAALNLATAGSLDLTESAIALSDALNGFQRDGMTAADAANILAGAANASSTSVHDMRMGLSQIGPVASGIGVSFREVNATLAAFSNNMLKSSDAGTSLKTFLANVQPQTKEARAMFEQYGLTTANGAQNIFFANGQLRDMSEVAGVLQEKFKKLSDQQRSDVFFKLFGSDAVRAANVLYKEGAEGIQKMYREMSDVTALDVAKKKMDTAAGAVEQFRGAVETLQIRALRPTLPYIKTMFKEAGDVIEKFTPAAVGAVKTVVDGTASYIKTHYINNPDFQKLDRQARFTFVIDDLLDSFNTWLDNGGSAQIGHVAERLGGTLGNALEFVTPRLTQLAWDVGAKVGPEFISGVSHGIKEATKDSWLGKVGKVAGFTPAGSSIKFLDGLFSGDYWNKELIKGKMQDDLNKFGSGGGFRSMIDGAANFTGYARGGIATSPHIGVVAEAGWPEAMIPLNGSARSKSLWETTGRALGVYPSGGGNPVEIKVNYAPVIYGAKEEIMPELERQQRSFMEQMTDVAHQMRRVSYGG